MSDEVIRESVLTCPECGAKTKETMPTDSCQYFYPCPGSEGRSLLRTQTNT